MKFRHSLSLCEHFRELSGWTWRKLGAADSLGVAFGEETITESLLLELASQHAGRGLRIRAYTKAEEGTGTKATGGLPTGADWSFWIANAVGIGIELRVQAKRQFPSGQYESLDGKGQQIKDLWNNRGRAVPLYVLYNGPFSCYPWGPSWPSFSCFGSCTRQFREPSAWGCSVAPVSGIPPHASPYPGALAGLRPWHCLVCGCLGLQQAKASLPHRVAMAVSALYSAPDAPKPIPGIDFTFFEPHEEAPEWAAWLNNPEEHFLEWKNLWVRTGLKGVMLIQQTSDTESAG
jgi:hypothetical protein